MTHHGKKWPIRPFLPFCILHSAFCILVLTASAQAPPSQNPAATNRPQPDYSWILHRNCGIHMTVRDPDCRDFDVEAMATEFSRLHVDYFTFFAAGYVTAYSRAMISELLTRYDVDGMKFGGSSYGFTHDPCYCPACRKAYAEATGKEIPTARDWTSPAWREFIRWRAAQTARVVQHLVDIVHSIRPGMPVLGNATDFGDPGWTVSSSLDIERLAEIQDAVQVEVQARAKNIQPQGTADWQYLRWPAETVRHLTSVSSKPILVVASYFYAWPWRRVAVPAAEQKVYLAQIAAHGGSIMVNLSGGPPAVHEDKRGFQAMEELYGFIRKHRDLYEGDQSVAEVALVYDHDSLMFYGNDDADSRLVEEFRGIEESLDRAHIPFDIISTRTLTPQTLARYRALVLPNLAWLADGPAGALANYVKGGGGLVATYESGRFGSDGQRRDPSNLAALLGVRFQGDPKPAVGGQRPTWQVYMKPLTNHPALDGLRDTKLLPLSGWFSPVSTLGSSTVLLARTAPFQAFPEGWSYPTQKDPDDPILIVNQNPGAGRTAYFATPIGKSFWQSRFPDLATLIRDTVNWAAVAAPPVRIEGPPTLHTSLRRSPGKFMVHCINLTGGERLFSELVPLHDIRISLRCDDATRVRRAWRASDAAELPTEKQASYVTARLDQLTDYDVVVFEVEK
jgi:hypothetical protein